MIKELEAHLKGLFNEVDIQNEDPRQISIAINISNSIQVTAFTQNRAYTSTAVRGDQDDYIFCSIPLDNLTESFLNMEVQ